MMKRHFIGVDIGGTKCAVCYGLYDGTEIELIDKKKIKTTNVQETVGQLIGLVENIIRTHRLGPKEISAIGISCGGPLDGEKGLILSPPNLPGWNEVHIVEIFEKHFHLPVYLQNDANACALAEWKMGAGRGCKNMIFMTFGTGLGAGLILNGQLYAGSNHNAGELGHIRLSDFGPVGYGKSGSFEGFCSGGGIAQLARLLILEKLQQGQEVSWCKAHKLMALTTKDVAEAALQGDELAKKAFKISAIHLGKGIAMLIDLLNPEMIVIGSVYTRDSQLMEKYLKETLAEEALPQSLRICRIETSVLGENIGDYGALSVAIFSK